MGLILIGEKERRREKREEALILFFSGSERKKGEENLTEKNEARTRAHDLVVLNLMSDNSPHGSSTVFSFSFNFFFYFFPIFFVLI